MLLTICGLVARKESVVLGTLTTRRDTLELIHRETETKTVYVVGKCHRYCRHERSGHKKMIMRGEAEACKKHFTDLHRECESPIEFSVGLVGIDKQELEQKKKEIIVIESTS